MSAAVTIMSEGPRDCVRRLTLNRPEKHNALDGQMIRELTDAARQIAADPGARAVIIGGAGKSFCAGADLGWMRAQAQATSEARAAQAQALFNMFTALDELPQLVIGVVHGQVLGGGVGLASVCDVVIAAPGTRFALSETRLGLIPATIAPFLMRCMGESALRRVGLHADMFTADAAKAMGLVSEIAAEADLATAVERHVGLVLAAAPGAVARAKALYRALARGEADEQHVTRALVERWQSAEAQQGIAAFFAREAPPWRG